MTYIYIKMGEFMAAHWSANQQEEGERDFIQSLFVFFYLCELMFSLGNLHILKHQVVSMQLSASFSVCSAEEQKIPAGLELLF